MIKHITLSALILISGSTFTAQQQTVTGKISAGMLKTTHRHAYMLTLPIIPVIWFIGPEVTDGPTILLASLIAWYCSGKLLKTTTQAIMDEFDIQPLEN